MKKVFVSAVVMCFGLVLISGLYGKGVEESCWELARLYWQCSESRYVAEDAAEGDSGVEYCGLVESFNGKLDALSERLTGDCTEENPELKEFSRFYRQCPEELKPVFDRIVKNVMIRSRVEGTSMASEKTLREYFPGYGYSEPGYKYRKGNEISSEFLYARWEDEDRTYSQDKEFELTVELKLVAELKLKFPDLEIIKEFGVEIGETLVYCAKVKIKTTTSLTFHTKKKYGHYKKWFELFKAEKTWFSDPVWEKCGTTYVNFVEPTGEEVASSLQ